MTPFDASIDILTGFALSATIYWLTAGIQTMFNAFRQVSEPEIE